MHLVACDKKTSCLELNSNAYCILYLLRNCKFLLHILEISKFNIFMQKLIASPSLFNAIKALSSSEHKETQESDCRSDLQEAISWYNRVLGFHIEGGRGMIIQFSFLQESLHF